MLVVWYLEIHAWSHSLLIQNVTGFCLGFGGGEGGVTALLGINYWYLKAPGLEVVEHSVAAEGDWCQESDRKPRDTFASITCANFSEV